MQKHVGFIFWATFYAQHVEFFQCAVKNTHIKNDNNKKQQQKQTNKMENIHSCTLYSEIIQKNKTCI
jgi:hypothetical protein